MVGDVACDEVEGDGEKVGDDGRNGEGFVPPVWRACWHYCRSIGVWRVQNHVQLRIPCSPQTA